MSGWAGFSDAELRRLQTGGESSVPVVSGRGQKLDPVKRSRTQTQRQRAVIKSTSETDSSPITPDQQLCRSGPRTEPGLQTDPGLKTQPALKPKPEPRTEPGPKADLKPGANTGSKPMASGNNGQQREVNEHERMSEGSEKNEELVLKELEKQEVEIRERSRLEQLQLQQKIMEEKNKKKKALLTKTIAEKSKQTRAETLKLQRIQKELQTLDDMVSHEISILRSRIEQASWDYSSARKRYEKTEVEFIAAKLELHKKTELKEQLTEHLCAIIQQNELRKARKLEELMEQLELQTDEGLEEEQEERREGHEEAQRVHKEEEKMEEHSTKNNQTSKDPEALSSEQSDNDGRLENSEQS